MDPYAQKFNTAEEIENFLIKELKKAKEVLAAIDAEVEEMRKADEARAIAEAEEYTIFVGKKLTASYSTFTKAKLEGFATAASNRNSMVIIKRRGIPIYSFWQGKHLQYVRDLLENKLSIL